MLRHRLTLWKLRPQYFGAFASYATMATRATLHTKRFAPLDPARSSESDAPRLKGIIFDVDGTLWYVLDFILRVRLPSSGTPYLCSGFDAANILLDHSCISIVQISLYFPKSLSAYTKQRHGA